jgi:hypothetical protein
MLNWLCCILALLVWLGTTGGITRQRRAARVPHDQDFKGRQFTAEVILWAVRWYLMFPISYRDLELMLLDRAVEVDHTTIFRWIQAYAAELEKRIRPHLRMSNGSWRVDETYVKVKGAGSTFIEPSTAVARRSTFCSRSSATPRPRSDSSARRWRSRTR